MRGHRGRIRDKDGIDYIWFDELTPFNFHDFAYKSEQAAQGEVDFYDPEGRSGFRVVSREVDLTIRLDKRE